MKYYLIVGEASGDLHASHLMRSLKKEDPEAEFRFFGGDLMAAEGGTLVRHYRELAYMGFIPVLMHLPTILKAQKECVADIRQWQPDVVILVDYPGFNLRVAKELSRSEELPAPRVYYYISPKIWAWKEWRIKSIRRYVDELFSILPFEKDFYAKYDAPCTYVGHRLAEEIPMEYPITAARLELNFSENVFKSNMITAVLPGSRIAEITCLVGPGIANICSEKVLVFPLLE